jgi:hypothetical protein
MAAACRGRIAFVTKRLYIEFGQFHSRMLDNVGNFSINPGYVNTRPQHVQSRSIYKTKL